MNAGQKEQVKAVIAEDATGTGEFAYTEGSTVYYCVLGGLGHAIGVSYDELQSSVWEPRLEEEYGLDMDQRSEMVNINDDHDDLGDRRAALIAWVDQQPTEDA